VVSNCLNVVGLVKKCGFSRGNFKSIVLFRVRCFGWCMLCLELILVLNLNRFG